LAVRRGTLLVVEALLDAGARFAVEARRGDAGSAPSLNGVDLICRTRL
jgi:hypothetical protein